MPTHQTFKLDAMKVSFQLPSDWGKDLPPDQGWRWQAIAPGYTAPLYVNAVPTNTDFAAIAPGYGKAVKKAFLDGDPRSTFSSTSTRIGSLPALKITVHYRDVSYEGLSVEVATIYAFVYGGLFYVFDYVATTKWIAKERPAFEQSIRSVRFLVVA